MSLPVQTLDEALAKRADEELTRSIDQDLRGAVDWASKLNEAITLTAKNCLGLVEINGVELAGENMITLRPRAVLHLMKEAAFAQTKDSNRAMVVRKFLEDFDRFRESLEALGAEPSYAAELHP